MSVTESTDVVCHFEYVTGFWPQGCLCTRCTHFLLLLLWLWSWDYCVVWQKNVAHTHFSFFDTSVLLSLPSILSYVNSGDCCLWCCIIHQPKCLTLGAFWQWLADYEQGGSLFYKVLDISWGLRVIGISPVILVKERDLELRDRNKCAFLTPQAWAFFPPSSKLPWFWFWVKSESLPFLLFTGFLTC